MSRQPSIRMPVVAGRFYPADAAQCEQQARSLCRASLAGQDRELPRRLVGAVVPHAGWVCSGRVAAATLRELHRRTEAMTLWMTGSVHTMELSGPALDAARAWQTPLGPVEVDTDLRAALAGLDGFEVCDAAHQYEHSLEVQLPFIRLLWGQAVKIVPCMIGPDRRAVEWGEQVGQLLADWPEPVAVVCSVDLTHYGPNYGFTPRGVGPEGYRWAHQVNDVRLLEMMAAMQAGSVVAETQTHYNTCGGGAIAAAVAACGRMGAEQGILLEHTDSRRELAGQGYDEDACNSVGYAGMVFA